MMEHISFFYVTDGSDDTHKIANYLTDYSGCVYGKCVRKLEIKPSLSQSLILDPMVNSYKMLYLSWKNVRNQD